MDIQIKEDDTLVELRFQFKKDTTEDYTIDGITETLVNTAFKEAVDCCLDSIVFNNIRRQEQG